ncbi:MAG: tetratricopeptide repeat protein [Deltaproteobacteria bacterium]|nr:tetratricopeptide repeat protein [Deltaproteobacteria bacterium]
MRLQKTFFPFFIIPFIILLIILTASRNLAWKNEISLWLDIAKKSQNKPRPHNNLGAYYMAEKDLENAFMEFKKAVELKPDFTEAISNLGFVYYDMGMFEEASALQEQALRLNPNFRNAHYGYALIMERFGQYDKAGRSWEMVIKLSVYEDKWKIKAREHVKEIDKGFKDSR